MMARQTKVVSRLWSISILQLTRFLGVIKNLLNFSGPKKDYKIHVQRRH